jgi:hypothetical protein
MPSLSLNAWFADRSGALDEIESAHRAVGGAGPGRRTATQQINQAYAVLLSSHFQGFCRDLHAECSDHLANPMPDPNLRMLMRSNLVVNRKLDAGNPNPGNLGADFSRFRLAFWPLVDASHARNVQRKVLLEQLNAWRNAIAHQDFSPPMLRGGRPILQLSQVQAWRKACDGLARSFDEVLRVHIQSLTGSTPW